MKQNTFTKIKKPGNIKVESNKYFHWELEFPEIFRAYNGFDCIVGNPPYIQIQTNSRMKKYYWISLITI